MIDPNVDPQFLRTLLAANAIWATVTLCLTGVAGLGALLWRRRLLKKAAVERAEICLHCRQCLKHLRGTGGTHVITNELCSSCAGAHPAAAPPPPPADPPAPVA